VSVPFFSGEHVRAAVAPDEALEAVRAAFVEHVQGNWFMPSKVSTGRAGSSTTTRLVRATPTHCHPVKVCPNLK